MLIEEVIETLTQGTILVDVLLIVGWLGWLLRRKGVKIGGAELVYRWIEENGLILAWLMAVIATMGSLFFSEVAKYDPCVLCWYQRILMYPLVLILGLAILKKDKNILPYMLVMSLMGLIIALYHYYVQVSGVEIVPCSVSGYSASCTQQFVLRYGYVTIVSMSATAFGLISSIGMVMVGKRQNERI